MFNYPKVTVNLNIFNSIFVFNVYRSAEELDAKLKEIEKLCYHLKALSTLESDYKKDAPEIYKKIYLILHYIIQSGLFYQQNLSNNIVFYDVSDTHCNLLSVLKIINVLTKEYIDKPYLYKNSDTEIYIEEMMNLADEIYQKNKFNSENDSYFWFKYKLYFYLKYSKIHVSYNSILIENLPFNCNLISVFDINDLEKFAFENYKEIISFLLKCVSYGSNCIFSIIYTNPNIESLFGSNVDFYSFEKYIEWNKIKQQKYRKSLSEEI